MAGRVQPGEDTIVAWAGAASPSALGMVRLSGPDSHKIAFAITSRAPKADCNFTEPRAFYARLKKPGGGALIDECISIWYRAPRSYTGEDMVEFSIHGNPLIGREIVDACVSLGARLASPGEFTSRAFLSGKLDLTQAEAVQELISAKSRAELTLARNMLSGGLRERVEEWYGRLIKMRAALEVVFDYPGETSDVSYSDPGAGRAHAEAPVSDEGLREDMRTVIAEILREMKELIKFHDSGRQIREGLRVVLAGAPNVGKSSLFNALAGYERALTDAEPGTTRDYLELTLGWEKAAITLIDTAGLRDDAERVESKGVERSRKMLADADAVLYVIDSSKTTDLYDAVHGAPAVSERQKLIIVFNKIDLIPAEDAKDLAREIVKLPKSLCVFMVSAHDALTVGKLREWLAENLAPLDALDRVLITDRHRAHVENARAALKTASESLRMGVPSDLVVIDIADAMKELGAITGREVLSDLLGEIFSGFCIGK